MTTALYREFTLSEVSTVLRYEAETGTFYWVKNMKGHKRAGDVAGWLHAATGYWVIGVKGRKYRANRLAWLFITGDWPPPDLDVDHENRIKSDNRALNLRLATRAQNNANVAPTKRNKSGIKGVHWHKRARKWCASIGVNNSVKYLGLFEDKMDAKRAYDAALKEMHGEFAHTVP